MLLNTLLTAFTQRPGYNGIDPVVIIKPGKMAPLHNKGCCCGGLGIRRLHLNTYDVGRSVNGWAAPVIRHIKAISFALPSIPSLLPNDGSPPFDLCQEIGSSRKLFVNKTNSQTIQIPKRMGIQNDFSPSFTPRLPLRRSAEGSGTPN